MQSLETPSDKTRLEWRSDACFCPKVAAGDETNGRQK